jgi:hypothetical protein
MPLAPDMTTVAVPCLRDRTFPLAITAGVFAQHKPQIRRELRRSLETAPIGDLRREL